MEYYEQKTVEDLVNTRGTRLWSQMNENSRGEKNRLRFVQEHGGFFTRNEKYWVWTSSIKEKNGYWLKRVDTGEKVFFENMSEFAAQNGMTAVKICELMNGKRKTYKGWTASEIREVKETVGSHEKIPEPKKKKIPITKTFVLVDMTTNQILTIPNLSQFAKNNNLDYANLKKVANGKMKSYKNLKLYNPLEQYKDSPEPK
jgi:hypothetical protein